MKNILETIVERSKPELERRKKAFPASGFGPCRFSAPPFAAVFRTPGRHIIAELKKASPSKGLIRADFDVRKLAKALESNDAAALSVLTERNYFLGSERNLELAAETVKIPLLRKDFIFDEYQIQEAKQLGASAVLLIAAMLEPQRFRGLAQCAKALGLDVLGEAHCESELETVLSCGSTLAGINARDLKTFSVSTERSKALLKLVPAGIPAIAESGMKNAGDLAELERAGARGFLIGETLMRAADPGAALRELMSC